MMFSRTGWQVLRLVFSVGLVALIASRVDLGQMAQTLTGADLWLVLLAVLVALGSCVVTSYKWQLLLAALGTRAPLGTLFGLNLVGLFYSLFLPGQLGGEVVKGIKLARYGVSGATTTVTIGVDRLTGMVALGVLALMGLALAPETENGTTLRLVALAVLVISLAPLVMLPLVFRLHGSLRLGNAWFTWPLARAILGSIGTLTTAFLQYRRAPGALAAALAVSLVSQTMVVAVNYLAALGLGVEIPFLGLTWIVALASVLHLVPLSLAGLGVREGAYVVLLQGYGVSDGEGLGLALLVFGIIVAQGLIGGVIDLAMGLRPFSQGDSMLKNL